MTGPLDPRSARGVRLADELAEWLARTELAIEERRIQTAAQTPQEVSTAA